MLKIKQKIEEFIYLLSTEDKYSEYDSRKSFNRVNKPDLENLLQYSSSPNQQEQLSEDNRQNTLEGVHEVKLAWRHIKQWLVKFAPDLNSSLQSKCTDSDLRDFQQDLHISLPNCVVEFFKLTDGQSNFSNINIETSGLFFGLKLMALDEIMIMTENWRKVSRVLNTEISQIKQTTNFHELSRLPMSHLSTNQYRKKFNGSEESSTRSSAEIRTSRSSSASSYNSEQYLSSQFNIPIQRSIPPGAVHETFAHPMWIPMVTDEVGNYIGIDLSPPPNGSGKYGQVILFGREFDFKYKVADNWGDFLLIFANDLELGNWDIKENRKNHDGDLFIGNEGELVFVDKTTKAEIPYLEVLKRRTLEKWISSLESSENEEHRQLFEEIKMNDQTILSVNSNSRTVDKFINDNLSIIDNVSKKPTVQIQPPSPQIPSGQTLGRHTKKSPLSQVVTAEHSDGTSESNFQELDITN